MCRTEQDAQIAMFTAGAAGISQRVLDQLDAWGLSSLPSAVLRSARAAVRGSLRDEWGKLDERVEDRLLPSQCQPAGAEPEVGSGPPDAGRAAARGVTEQIRGDDDVSRRAPDLDGRTAVQTDIGIPLDCCQRIGAIGIEEVGGEQGWRPESGVKGTGVVPVSW
jgi:hypothetical protein